MYHAYMENEEPEDGIIWNATTFEDAADMHLDGHVIPNWVEYDRPHSVKVCVVEYDQPEDEPVNMRVFEYDIEMTPVRGFGRLQSST